jgi:hypothetical protein
LCRLGYFNESTIRERLGRRGAFGPLHQGEVLSRAVMLQIHGAEGSREVFLLEFDAGCQEFQSGPLEKSPLGPQTFFSLFAVSGRGKFDESVEIGEFAIVEINLLMKIAQKVLISPRRGLFHGVSF